MALLRTLQTGSLFLIAFVLFGLTAANPAITADESGESPGLVRIDSVSATGPVEGTTLEDQVEISWTTDASVLPTSSFHIKRDGVLIRIAAPTVSIFQDLTALPGVSYNYCVYVVDDNAVETLVGCDTGGRLIARPTGFEASKGLFEQYVRLSWSDRSEIEGGYNIYRDAGNALDLDGVEAYVMAGLAEVSGDFTFEFWAKRASTGTEDYVVNLELDPNGDPVDPDVEIGFNDADQFQVVFGTDALVTDTAYVVDTDWHHWAVAFDADSGRRIIYRDGEVVTFDVTTERPESVYQLEIGRQAAQGPRRSRGFFGGQIDELRYWNTALTAEQVQSRMTGLLTGFEASLISYWPMDVADGLVAPDIVGDLPGEMINMNPTDWVTSGVPELRAELGPDMTSYLDLMAVVGYQSYNYRIAAFEDVNNDGSFTPGDFESLVSPDFQEDDGWRAFLTPPGNVSATDGQFNDKVVISWSDGSDGEDSYRIYREGTLIGTVAQDEVLFADTEPTMGEDEYCVAGVAGGIESLPTCDLGMAGGLASPADVAATDNVYDDRVSVTWTDVGDTESGFEIYRDGNPLATVDSDTEEYSDFSAVQDVAYDYCVGAFSNADPLNPAVSDTTCAPMPGRRAIVLKPTDVTASLYEFEDRVEIGWSNPSTTAMLFMVYRDSTSLIEVLDFNMASATDVGMRTDDDIKYCVAAATVTSSNAAMKQGQIAQVLATIAMDDDVRKTTGEDIATIEQKMSAVREALGIEAGDDALAIAGLVESERVCAIGGRSIAAATGMQATDNEFENHVQLDWTDNSSIESGYYILRGPAGSPVPIDTVSANRTTYGDYTGVPGVQYEYSIEAFDEYDERAPGDADLGQRTLEPPTGLEASDGTSETVVELDWNDNSDAEIGYRISRRNPDIPNDPWAEVGTTGTNEPAFSDVISDPNDLGQPFEYKVVAYDLYGESLAATNPGHTMLEAPANVNASDVYENEVVVVWVDRSDVDLGYVVTRRQVGTNTMVDLPPPPDPALTTITDVPGDTEEYEYCVLAKLSGTIRSEPTCDVGQLFDPSGGGTTGGGVEPLKIVSPFQLGNSVDIDLGIRFGQGVAMSGQFALIGAPGADPGTFLNHSDGLAFPFLMLSPPLNLPWLPLPRFRPPSSANYNADGFEFGSSVDISGDYLIIGDPYADDDGAGRFSIYKKRPTTAEWDLKIEDGGHQGGLDNTGAAVAMAGQYAVVGNPQYAMGLPTNSGGATICDAEARAGLGCDRDNGIPKLEDLLLPVARADSALFGAGVDIMREGGDLFAIVGAPGNEAAYIFKCNIPGTTVADPPKAGCSETNDWTRTLILESRFSSGSEYGAAVAINSQLAVVGAPGARGLAVYERDGATWIEAPVTTRGQAGEFGAALALFNNLIVVGAPGEAVSGIVDAGAIYVFEHVPATSTDELVRYDARAGGQVLEDARFGTSVDFDGVNYLVGSPGDDGFLNAEMEADSSGAAYSIPFGFEPPDTAVIPSGVDLVTPEGIAASDGTAPDRIQIRWDDESDDEDGHIVYRQNKDGEFDRLSEVSANVEFFDDFEAAPGEAYTYCVTAFFDESETEKSCDIGWRPPNGTIAGRIAEQLGGGTDEAQVCLVPNPNKSLLFDGVGGFVESTVGEELDLSADFSIEAWIRPQDVQGSASIVSKPGDWAFGLDGDNVQFTLFRDQTADATPTDSRTILPGVWTHVAASFVDISNVRTVTFFVNGRAGSPISVTGLSNVAGDTLTIGYQGDDTATYFNGEIDELRIWSGPRTEGQVMPLRNLPLVGDEENLLGYWPLDQGSRRVVPDLSESANHGRFQKGVYLADEGADLDICAVTGDDGNYSISGIRYGEITEFNVIPNRPGRQFSPSFKKITLAIETPVQNEVFFSDVTAYGVSGIVQYMDVVGPDTLSCPVPDVVMHVGKTDVATDDNVKKKTGADGSYAVSVDPSVDDSDSWFFIPQLVDPNDGALVHTFTPAFIDSAITEPKFDYNFIDNTRFRLSGNLSGGDPVACGRDIGVATIRITTQDGCYDRTITVHSGPAGGVLGVDEFENGFFDLDLPPLEYLVEVVDIQNAPPERELDIKSFFSSLGAVEVDLRGGDLERNLIYRAPLTLQIGGLEEDDACRAAGGITELDENNNVLRTLPPVQTILEYGTLDLDIRVLEDYGSGTCEVEEGTITIFDAIADRVDVDSTMALTAGGVQYTTFGASPNIFSGARIQGVDRSFQKPLTVVAQVEGRKSLVQTEWAIVEGTRERSSTFVSATTERFPLMILHDPPGSHSVAFIEEGTTWCNTISNTKLVGGGAGASADIALGFKSSVGFSFGAHLDIAAGAGIYGTGTTKAGREDGSLNGENIELCFTTTENLTTSDDNGWVGEDMFVGVALNLIFALADVLEKDACTITLTETLATDLDQADPFETAYAYGESHISLSLIPELENLIRLGGDVTLNGELNEVPTSVRLQESLDNWKRHLQLSEDMIDQGVASSCPADSHPECVEQGNRSFSGGTNFTHTETADTTTVTAFESTRIYFETSNTIGAIFNIGFDSRIGVTFDVHSEWNSENKETTATTKSIGYTLTDEDAGDFFSIDIGKDPRYGTFVFKTVSGRSSNPWEANTQKRDNPIITVDPPVAFDVDPSGSGAFQLTLINGSESDERRRYVIAAPAQTNKNNLGIVVGGARLGGTRDYLLDPGKAITVNMDVIPSPASFSYERVGIVMYPPDEYPIWAGDTRLPFALSDTAFFSVYFDSTGGNVQTSVLAEGWNWVSINRDGGLIDSVFKLVHFEQGDRIRDQLVESRYDSTRGWIGDLTEIKPGEGYRMNVQRPGFFRLTGEPVASTEPVELVPGWNWVGYLPTKRTHLGEALESLGKKVQEGDAVVGQDGFAQYVNGAGWVGTLTDMVPGESYALYLASGGELLYPLEPTNEGRPVIPPRETTVRGPEWQVESGDYTTSMTVVAEVLMGSVPLEQTTTKIAVFAGDEIRGIGEVHYVEGLDKHLAFIMIHGEFEDETQMVVHAYDGETDILYEDIATINYAAQQMLGQPAKPVALDLTKAGLAPELLDLPEEFALYPNYPNPFNATTTIGYDLPEAADVSLVVYDLLGRRVVKLVDSEQNAGRHKVVFDARRLASGFYMYRMEAGDFTKVGKLILVK